MHKVYFIFVIILMLMCSQSLTAQPPAICKDPPRMTSFCKDACIICDIDGYTGRHNSNINGWLPPDFCTTIVHNAQWIAFIAGSTNLKIELSVKNCNSGSGLEMTVYSSNDCQTFQKVFQCDGDVIENNSRIFTNTVPLTIGQYYYLAMDGNGGDNCDWTLKVLEGTTEVSPLDSSGILEVPQIVCEQTEVEFNLNAPIGATEFYWSVNNNSLPTNKSKINYSFPSPGKYDVCVYAANACDDAPPICKAVEVKALPVVNIVQQICENDCYQLSDTIICDEGFHQIHYPLPIGCDSVINLQIIKHPQPNTNLKATICNGDTIFIDDIPFTTTDLFKVNIDRAFCDSIVNLDLTTIECNIEGNASVKNLSCYQSSDGSITFKVINGTAPFQYVVKDFYGNNIKSDVVSSLNKNETITGLDKGIYFVEINDYYGNSEVIICDIFEPPLLQSEVGLKDFNGYNIQCQGMTGVIWMYPSGGTPLGTGLLNYDIRWSHSLGSFNPATGLLAGDYSITITDKNGCSIIKNVTLTQPPEITFDLNGKNPLCDDPTNTGVISVINAGGGVKPYQYSLYDTLSFSIESSFQQLAAGAYKIYFKDANKCIRNKTIQLFNPEIPDISLPDVLEVELGDSIDIDASSNLEKYKSILWSGDYSYSCDTCLSTNYFPYKTSSAVLTLASYDDCVDVDSVEVRVINNRHVYFANIFNINSTINNVFSLNSGKGIKDILRFNIYDRWGNLVHKASNINNHSGWDGTLDGKPCEQGVYIWMADVRYLDDTIETFKGDITLIK